MELFTEWASAGLPALFLACFLAATILPFSSEALLLAMALGPWGTLPLLLTASIGNTLGGMTNYGIGRWLPVIGDPIAIALGLFRTPAWPVLVLMFMGKAVRYAVLVAAVRGW